MGKKIDESERKNMIFLEENEIIIELLKNKKLLGIGMWSTG